MTLEDATQTIGRPKTHGDKSGMLSSKAGRPATLRISVFQKITPHSACIAAPAHFFERNIFS
jgi:hypothetical protein